MFTPNGELVTRRHALRDCALGFGSLALTSLLAETGMARLTAASSGKAPHFEAKAKRMLFLFMKGGPSHIDTFDPKPQLDKDHGKPYPGTRPRVTFANTGTLLRSPWKFQKHGKSGTPVSSLFPQVAKHVDNLCFIHSVHGTNPAHGGALLKLHTGSDNFVRPSMGAWVAYGLGSLNDNLPAFITICPTLAHGGVNNWGSAFLPAECAGVPIGNASVPVEKAKVRYIDNPRLPRDLQRKQLDLLAELNRDHLGRSGPDLALEGRLQSFELAFRMQTAIPEAEDISRESPATQTLYGLDDPTTAPFGRQCLLARRFLEKGVRFVQVTHSDAKVQWDQHSDLKNGHEKNAREVDRPIAGLLKDLKSRGLLDDTLVIWGGEFGRTPTVEGSTDGRDHNPEGFTVWLAGGGVKGGFHYGATDDHGWYAVENRVHIHDLHATLLHLLGLDHEKLTFRHAGRDFRLTDVHGHVVKEIMA